MIKSIGKIFYFIFIIAVTFIVSNFSEASKVMAFLKGEKDQMLISNEHLISATTISNYRDKTNALVLKEPLYHEDFISYNEDNSINNQISVYIYTFAEFKGTKAYNNLGFIIKNVKLNINNILLDDNNNPVVYAKLYYSKPIQIDGQEFMTSTETFIPIFETNTGYFQIKHDVLKNNTTFSTISQIEVVIFDTLTKMYEPLIVLNTGEENDTDYFSETFNRDISSLTTEKINILKDSLENLMISDKIYYTPSLNDNLNKYNYFYFRDLGLELVIFVIPLTYFIFFHKYVMERIKEKRKLKDELVESYKKEYLENDNKNNK
ncbi:MAG: hypothetical protein RBQ97_01805 [Acholeplasma sp.]|nr:hypothetical protein [Acholeplasma sp.]